MNEEYTTPYDKASNLLQVKQMKVMPVKAPFGYFGSKQRIASQIIHSLPPHNAWVEAFCGSAAITLSKQPAPIEVINDQDNQIVNLFRQLRDNPETLCRSIALTPYARVELQMARSKLDCDDPIEQARRFLIRSMMSINGTMGNSHSGFSHSQSYAREGKEARVNRWYNLPERLQLVVNRLRCVRVENRDARELVNMFSNRPATLVYLDPPYFVKRFNGYSLDANDFDFHSDLLKLCIKSKSMILISGYDNDLYNTLLTEKAGWVKTEIDTKTRDTTGKDFSRTEVLWKNINYIKAEKNRRIPIRLSAKEKANNKINPPR